MTERIAALIDLEWSLFDQVHNEGGRASCQNDPRAFRAMRASQFAVWPDELVESYHADLKDAIAEGRNPLAEKYAFMMASTSPDTFREMEDMLPRLSEAALVDVESIVAVNVAWEREVDAAFPAVRAGGRPLTSAEDTPWATSFETYLRGELKTYSPRTLALYAAFTRVCAASGRNLARENAENIVRAYGYASLEAAEAARAAKRDGQDLA